MAMLSRASGLVHGNEKAPPEEAGRVMLAKAPPGGRCRTNRTGPGRRRLLAPPMPDLVALCHTFLRTKKPRRLGRGRIGTGLSARP
jgi:hypothetical protein